MSRPAGPRLVRAGALLTLQLVEQHGERPVEHRVVVTRRHDVAEQVFRAP
jgi:hypothetical protein